MALTALPNNRTDGLPACLDKKRNFAEATIDGARPNESIFANLCAPRKGACVVKLHPYQLGPVDKLDSQARQDVIQDSFCGGYLGAVADGGCRVDIL